MPNVWNDIVVSYSASWKFEILISTVLDPPFVPVASIRVGRVYHLDDMNARIRIMNLLRGAQLKWLCAPFN